MARSSKLFLFGYFFFMLSGAISGFGMTTSRSHDMDEPPEENKPMAIFGSSGISETSVLIGAEGRKGKKTGQIQIREYRKSPMNGGGTTEKVSGLLLYQIELRTKQLDHPTPDRLARMKSIGMRVENMSMQRIFIYLSQKPNAVQLEELQDMNINVDLDSWIPPVGNHPAGFLVADIPIEKLNELAEKSYVVRLDTAEKTDKPLTMPGNKQPLPTK